jgi:putative transposase
MTQLQFFNPYAEIRHTGNRLPHWQQRGAVYFITFRLADSIPNDLRQDWERERETWLDLNLQPWSAEIEQEYHQRFSGMIERWLDAGYGSCALRRRECTTIVDQALHHFDGTRLALISSVVMPNHVHALFVQNAERDLEQLLRSWKSYSARRINALGVGVPACCGNEIISIVSCGTSSILKTAFVTSEEIRRRQD